MTSERFELRGEVFVTLASAAELYRVELRWVEQVYAHGLLGPGERVSGEVAITERDLDRLAALVRWHRHCGLELELLTALYG